MVKNIEQCLYIGIQNFVEPGSMPNKPITNQIRMLVIPFLQHLVL